MSENGGMKTNIRPFQRENDEPCNLGGCPVCGQIHIVKDGQWIDAFFRHRCRDIIYVQYIHDVNMYIMYLLIMSSNV